MDQAKYLEELGAARHDLLRVLEDLEPLDWDKRTHCDGWRVRDVVSHLAATADSARRKSMFAISRSRGNCDEANDQLVRELGQRPVEEILAHFRSTVETASLPRKVAPADLLIDVVIHSLDICHSNGWELHLPADRMKMVLSQLVTIGGPHGGKERATGLHLDTTDIDWRCGCGDHVRGPSRAMLLALAGRTPVCDQLVGDGVAELAQR